MAKILGLDESKLKENQQKFSEKQQGNVKEVTLDNITNEDIIAMANYIQQLEQLNKDQRGYILQLQQQLTNAGKKLSEFHQMYRQQQGNVTTFVEVESKLDL